MRWPDGITSAGVACGIKPDGRLDLGVMVAETEVAWSGTFTRNAAAAAPVRWSRGRLGSPVRAIVVNSGNANACTGEDGAAAVGSTARAAARAIGCEPEQVLVASTGPIGVRLPTDGICTALPGAADLLSTDAATFAEAILTTDSVTKSSTIQGDGFVVAGVAKGAAMLAPNMATMLAFIATDAALDGSYLQGALSEAVRVSFDRICVDACESTNDSVFLLSTGRGPSPDVGGFGAALTSVCRDLAEQMVRDAEGGSRFVRIRIAGARSEDHAATLARAVAASALWRAALHGGDPNWGRVLSALGSVDRSLDLEAVELRLGTEVVFAGGKPVGSLSAAAEQMKAADLEVVCRVGTSDTVAEVLTTDLSPEYVTLNATGTS